MRLEELASKPNLELAWRRITTGGNHQYKTYFRALYSAYELSLDHNLADLRQRVLAGTFEPRRATRVYLPKESGLHRPLTLLNLEDQIVLQAFANIAASRIYARRQPLQSQVVFSNILEAPNSIFFFRKWQDTYTAFQKRARRFYRDGLRWVGDFDLAAFYDTISHGLLLQQLFPRNAAAGSPSIEWVAGCLRTWSSEHVSSGHDHGLPQGPLASDFLAEAFLLPIDRRLADVEGYIRYVDDVRLFGRTEDEVRAKLTELERLCREQGLIPQTGKFAIKRMASISEATAMLPSLTDPQHAAASTGKITGAEAQDLLASALSGRPIRVVDKTRLRYILYRAESHPKVLATVIRLLPRHPEHSDAFFHYLAQFDYRRTIESACLGLVASSPYGHVRGESWHVIARFLAHPRSQARQQREALVASAREVLRAGSQAPFNERWGAAHFLCIAETFGRTRSFPMLRAQSPLLQSFIAPALPDRSFEVGGLVSHLIVSGEPEPGLALCAELHRRGLSPGDLGASTRTLSRPVDHALRELGLISGDPLQRDLVADVLWRRYGTPRGKSWQRLLGDQYRYALGLLRQAEASFNPSPSYWIGLQNSFNQAIFLALQRHLQATAGPGACKTHNRIGELVDFGVTLDANNKFAQAHPALGAVFRDVNARRNRVPSSHPYQKRSAAQATYLTKRERDAHATALAAAYQDFVVLMP